MSQFLPETGAGAPQTDSVGSLLTPATLDISSGDIALMQKVLSAASRNPNLIPSDFMAYIVDYIQTSRLSIPIGQVFGFSGFQFQAAASINVVETTGSTSYTDLATAGPQITGLGNGQYAVFFGCRIAGASTNTSIMNVSSNGTTPDDTDAIESNAGNQTTSRLILRTLQNNNSNTLKAVYKAGAAGQTGTFTERTLIAVKYENA